MPYRRGDVVLVRYPDSTLTTFKQRPALVIQADNLPTGLAQSILVMISSNLARTGPTRVPVALGSSTGQQMGLLLDSVIVTDNLATVLDRAILRVLGACPVMQDVDTALRITLNLL